MLIQATSRTENKNDRARARFGFTLVELLVAIAIIGVLVGMVLYSLAGAQRDAITMRTQGTIKKINDILLPMWEEYRYRSVRINIPPALVKPFKTATNEWTTMISPREGARARMLALRDLMRMEMPDRYTDLVYSPIQLKIGIRTADNYGPAPDTSNDFLPTTPPERDIPGRFLAMRQTMVVDPASSAGSLKNNPYDGPVAAIGTLVPTPEHQSAELLYEIIANSTYMGGSSLEFFAPSEIGDTDNDGFKEFLDGWGRPIYWIRWPAGSPSPLNDGTIPDPMDPIKTDWRWNIASATKPWMLVPLIVSAGPDGEFDTVFDFVGTTPVVNPTGLGSLVYPLQTWTGPTDPGGIQKTGSVPYYFPDPWVEVTTPSNVVVRVGATWDTNSDGIDNAIDNISNYELVLP